MHHDRTRRLALAGVGLVLALLAVSVVNVLRSEDRPRPPIARDQLFFVGDGGSVLLALIVQRVPIRHRDASIEAKSFLVWDGRFETPFYTAWEVEDYWPATIEDVTYVSPSDLRIRVQNQPFCLIVRRPAGALELSAPTVTDAGTGDDPHGEVAWTAGRGTLNVNGKVVDGTVLIERLSRPTTAWPRFGKFEMWLLAPPEGGLVLGRTGSAVVIPRHGPPRHIPFAPVAEVTRADPDSGFRLPIRWNVGGKELDRVTGSVGRGTSPGGGPAVYDISFARGEGAALVFHLED